MLIGIQDDLEATLRASLEIAQRKKEMKTMAGMNGMNGASVLTTPAPTTTASAAIAGTNTGNGTRSLYQKLVAVLGEVSYIQKDKRNSFHGYTYASEAAIKSALHAAFAEHGVTLLPPQILEITDGEKDAKGHFLTTIKVRIRIADADTGETVEGEMYGRGVDNQDKGIYKALTGALKYFLTTTFLISTGDDPEQEPEPDTKQRKQTPAAAAIAEEKIASGKPLSTEAPWKTLGEMSRLFLAQRERVGEVEFLGELARWEWRSIEDIRKAVLSKDPQPKAKAIECYTHLTFLGRVN